jgi:hypothetical protein
MGLLGSSLVLYLLLGGAVAVAVYLSDRERRPGERFFLVLTAVPFWPLYLPGLLSRGSGVGRAAGRPSASGDELDEAIAQAEAELDAALNSLGGLAVPAREKDRLRELRAAWHAQAERVREMDRLLSLPDGAAAPSPLDDRLRRLRQSAHEDLLASLARVRELVSLLHLARFTETPAARAEELVARIAAAAEGVSGAHFEKRLDELLDEKAQIYDRVRLQRAGPGGSLPPLVDE